MLDPEVLLRVAQTGATDGLQDSNQKLLQRLIDAGVFQRMAEAQALNPNVKSYTGLDMLYDLNDGLFSELARAPPTIELYRRELQRAYVSLLVQRVEGPPSEFRAGRAIGRRGPVGEDHRRRSRKRRARQRLTCTILPSSWDAFTSLDQPESCMNYPG